MADKTFVKVTNRDIYEMLTTIDQKLSKLNGTTKWHTWAIGVLLLLIVAIITKIL